jgi:hypothetical protein
MVGLGLVLIARTVIVRDAAAEKSGRCHRKGKEQDVFHGIITDEVKR